MTENFYKKYRTNPADGLPKYAELREIIRAAVNDDYWREGDKLPAENVIASITPYSLGTVQKALGALVKEGVLIRHHGRGTFVAEAGKHPEMDKPWHCRFALNEEDEPLPIYPKVILRNRIRSNEKWAKMLAPDGGYLIQIDRIISIDHQFPVYVKFYLSDSRFGSFMEKHFEELEKTNFKTILHTEYNVAVSHMNYSLRFETFSKEIAEQIESKSKTTGIVYEILANTASFDPIYYQEIFIPPNHLKLLIGDPTGIPDIWK